MIFINPFLLGSVNPVRIEVPAYIDVELFVRDVLQEKELSAELFTFHEAVSQLQEIEDEVLDSHKAFIEMQHLWLRRCTEIQKRTKEVDFDQDGNYNVNSVAQTTLQLIIIPFVYCVLFVFALPYFCSKT